MISSSAQLVTKPPVVKAIWCKNSRQEKCGRGKAGSREEGKEIFSRANSVEPIGAKVFLDILSIQYLGVLKKETDDCPTIYLNAGC